MSVKSLGSLLSSFHLSPLHPVGTQREPPHANPLPNQLQLKVPIKTACTKCSPSPLMGDREAGKMGN